MTLEVAACVVVANIAFGLSSRWLAQGLTPRTATRLISLVSFITTLASGFVLSVVCFDFLAQIPSVAAAEAWSVESLDVNGAIPLAVGLSATLGVVAAATRAVYRVTRVAQELWSIALTCRLLADGRDDLVVIEDATPDAYALPGIGGGRVVVTSAMLSALDEDEVRVLIAHEASHLRHHHHLYITLAELAAAANPLIRRVPAVVRLAVERWADEDAARAIGDRRLTARSVARAGLLTLQSPQMPRSALALAITGSSVSQRARALLAPAPRTRPRVLGLTLAVVLLTSVGTVKVAHLTEHRFEQARMAYLHR